MVRIYIFSLFFMGLYGTFVGKCPTLCQCRNGALFCVNSGLSHILHLRSSRHLKLAGNLAECIRPSGLWLYTNLSVWDFQSGSTKLFNYGSFYHLRNLVELQLVHLPSERATVKTINDVAQEVRSRLKRDGKRILRGNTLKMREKPIALKSLQILLSEDTGTNAIETSDMFQGLQKLQTVNLSGNRLSSLPDRMFTPLSSLSELMLDNNFLSEIKQSDLTDLGKLKVLTISHNRLSRIHSSAFRDLNQLEVLKLNGNHISEIKTLTFQHCSNLRVIDLSDNDISRLDDLTFKGLFHLRSLGLSNNRLFYLNPQVLGSSTQLQWLNLTGNVWKCDCRLLSLKSWLESGRNGLVTVECSHPESFKGQYLHTISSALIRSTGGPCSLAHARVQSNPFHSGSSSRVTKKTWHDGDVYHTRCRVGRTAPQLKIKHREIQNTLQSKKYQGMLILQNKTVPAPVVRSPRSSNFTRQKADEEDTANVACSYNQLVILNVSVLTVTSNSALIKWTLAKNDIQNIYFRVMYDHFHTHARFSRFVNVKHGTVCNLWDLRPSTPYLVCVESVVEEKVCQVASRDLCLGVITKPEEMSTLEPQTIILYFSGFNAFAILAILALFACMGCILKKKLQADALSLLYSRDKSISCAMCAGIPMSDRTSGMNTTSSHTGTYQQNDAIDAIELPAA